MVSEILHTQMEKCPDPKTQAGHCPSPAYSDSPSENKT